MDAGVGWGRVEELVGKKGDTAMAASTELSRLQLWLGSGCSPLLLRSDRQLLLSQVP